jgi:hypothetical protein
MHAHKHSYIECIDARMCYFYNTTNASIYAALYIQDAGKGHLCCENDAR